MNLLPQPCQAAGEQSAGLLCRMLADHLELAQYRRNFLHGQRRQAFEKLLAALQAQAVESNLQAFGGFGEAGIGGVIGFAHH